MMRREDQFILIVQTGALDLDMLILQTLGSRRIDEFRPIAPLAIAAAADLIRHLPITGTCYALAREFTQWVSTERGMATGGERPDWLPEDFDLDQL